MYPYKTPKIPILCMLVGPGRFDPDEQENMPPVLLGAIAHRTGAKRGLRLGMYGVVWCIVYVDVGQYSAVW
jgi:hypothetical protein